MRPLGATAHRPGPRRRDPAPSRLAYRLHRLWLTPLVRRLVRVGLPAGALALLAWAVFADADRRAAIAAPVDALVESIRQRPEFMIGRLEITGASDVVERAVRARGPDPLPASSFDVNLDALREEIEALDAVASAELQLRGAGVLAVRITERRPAILWRSTEGLSMLDRGGHRIARVTRRAARPDLPVIAGAGADAHVGEALALIETARPLADRLRGLTRMGERRWDVVLDGGQRIMLPAEAPERALERVIALDQARDLLDRAVEAVDMRNPARPTVRMAGPAVAELRRIRQLERGESGR
ncbi:cell division protein FtsQ [Rhodobacteraceae bacterium WD3A24]|nr:cell division protein FtsQ [Rhodobacteraceae bacterium WD3A24]